MIPSAQATPIIPERPAQKKNQPTALTKSHGSAPIAVIVYLIGTLAELYACLWQTRGVFTYGVDDGYIHLALAERILHGTYGLNLHEFSAPASSILWPFLLLVGVGTSWHVYVPLVVNVLCGFPVAWIVGLCVDEWPRENEGSFAPLKRSVTVVLFVVGLNLLGLTFLGMEHMLQILLTAACAYGVIRVSRGAAMPLWCLVAAAAGPAIRYENLAVTVAVAMVLFWSGNKRTALWTLLASLVVPVAFSLFLVAHGWSILPGSVLAKGTNGFGLIGFLITVGTNVLKDFTDVVRLCWTIALLAVAELWWLNRRSRPMALAAVAIVLALDLVIGRIGNYRYECFAVAFASLILLAILGRQYRVRWHLAMLAFLICTWPYFRYAYLAPVASLNIYQQQYQMARFAQGFYKKNFAANDIGLVSYRLPESIYVADTAGLASRESLLQTNKSGAWLDDFTRRHDAGLAMIYTSWVKGIPSDWTLMGRLVLGSELVSPQENTVDFYATSVGDPAEIDRQLRAFQKTLPRDVVLLLRKPPLP